MTGLSTSAVPLCIHVQPMQGHPLGNLCAPVSPTNCLPMQRSHASFTYRMQERMDSGEMRYHVMKVKRTGISLVHGFADTDFKAEVKPNNSNTYSLLPLHVLIFYNLTYRANPLARVATSSTLCHRRTAISCVHPHTSYCLASETMRAYGSSALYGLQATWQHVMQSSTLGMQWPPLRQTHALTCNA